MDKEAASVFKYFEEISKIPHGSGNEEAISLYVLHFAEKLGLWAKRDVEKNVIIRKNGCFGLENSPRVILQGHLDMVCEKNNDVVFDFEKDPLKLIIDGDFIRADGTTLGADNGVATAICMALLKSNDIPHPPLEVVLTTNEEVGLTGAANLSPSDLTGKLLINLDSEEEGIIYTGCAGGVRAVIEIPIEYEPAESDCSFCKIAVKGLKGGHSGIDIDKERGNANKLLGRVLLALHRDSEIRLVEIKGGAKDNAIPRESEALIAVRDYEKSSKITSECNEIFKKEYRASEASLEVEILNVVYNPNAVFSLESTDRVINAINIVQNGIFNMSVEVSGLVETSNNLGIIETEGNRVLLTNVVRSNVKSRKNAALAHLEAVAASVGAVLVTNGDYPAWEFAPRSPLRDVFVETYRELYKSEPTIAAVHAGLECGFFPDKVEGIDMISVGPQMYDVHTPDERLSISSMKRFWEFLIKVLGRIK